MEIDAEVARLTCSLRALNSCYWGSVLLRDAVSGGGFGGGLGDLVGHFQFYGWDT